MILDTLSDVRQQYADIIRDIEDGLVFDEEKLDVVTYLFWKEFKNNNKEKKYE